MPVAAGFKPGGPWAQLWPARVPPPHKQGGLHHSSFTPIEADQGPPQPPGALWAKTPFYKSQCGCQCNCAQKDHVSDPEP